MGANTARVQELSDLSAYPALFTPIPSYRGRLPAIRTDVDPHSSGYGYLPVNTPIEHGVARFMYKTLLLNQWPRECYRDSQAPTAVSIKDDVSTDALLLELQPDIEAISGCRLVPTVSYARLYFHGDSVLRHRDRDACEVSASIRLGEDGGESSLSFAPDNKIEMDDSDGAVYLGCQAEHWRDRFTGRTLSQLFLHYVVAAGPFTQQYFGGRPERFPRSISARESASARHCQGA
jgi:hypothetical protein